MLPIGTRVIVRGADHLSVRQAERLVGRCGVVVDHENGMNVVDPMTRLSWLTGLYVFPDSRLIRGVVGPVPWLPAFYRVRSYRIPADA